MQYFFTVFFIKACQDVILMSSGNLRLNNSLTALL